MQFRSLYTIELEKENEKREAIVCACVKPVRFFSQSNRASFPCCCLQRSRCWYRCCSSCCTRCCRFSRKRKRRFVWVFSRRLRGPACRRRCLSPSRSRAFSTLPPLCTCFCRSQRTDRGTTLHAIRSRSWNCAGSRSRWIVVGTGASLSTRIAPEKEQFLFKFYCHFWISLILRTLNFEHKLRCY